MSGPWIKRGSWTAERRDAVIELYTVKGLSTRQIAEKLGATTRNAVLGLLHRAGVLIQHKHKLVERRPRDEHVWRRAHRKKPKTEFTVTPDPANGQSDHQSDPAPFTEEPAGHHHLGPTVYLLDASFRQCRFIIGNKGMCCGRETQVGSSWCAEHRAICFIPHQPRRDPYRTWRERR